MVSTLEKIQLLIDDKSVKVYSIIEEELDQMRFLLRDNYIWDEDEERLVKILKHFIHLCCLQGSTTLYFYNILTFL